MTPRSKKITEAMKKHALTMPDREVCGFVYQDFYYPLNNLAHGSISFYADPADVAFALAHFGEPAAIFHTHPTGTNSPSEIDVSMSYYNNSTMIIGIIRDGKFTFKEYIPAVG
jgi:proteasome lid subunit RPN8/RPN11